MASINYGAREISVKIVYYGPGLSGKTTNLQVIHRKIPPEHKSDMVSLATETDRTLFFDFLPLDLGTIKGFSTKFQLYTVPGQVYYNATRKLVLRGVDGVVFVADSAADKIQENLESFQNLEDNLSEYHYKREEIPVIIQYNKRDLPNALSVEELHQYVNRYNLPWSEAVANKGIGVFDSLKLIGKIVIDTLNKKYSRLSRGVAASPAAGVRPPQPAPLPPAPAAATYAPPMPPVPPAPQQQYQGYQPQTYGNMPSTPAPSPYRQFPSQPAMPPLQQPSQHAARQSIPFPAQQHQAPSRMPPEGDYYQQPAVPQPDMFAPPPPQSGYAPAPEIPRPGSYPGNQQPQGFVNFEPLPLEPAQPKPPQARQKGYALPSDSGQKNAPAHGADEAQDAETFEKRPGSQQQMSPGSDQTPRGNEHTVMFPQKQQRPARPQIDERDYSVYHIDSSPSSFPNSPSSLGNTSAPNEEETDSRQAPGTKQQKGFLSKFFNRDA
jgi:signal recognition particle receptor subunit beta